MTWSGGDDIIWSVFIMNGIHWFIDVIGQICGDGDGGGGSISNLPKRERESMFNFCS